VHIYDISKTFCFFCILAAETGFQDTRLALKQLFWGHSYDRGLQCQE
jgi:hypothetical protein